MANPFENFKSTPFVSQYAGLPLDEFLQSAGTLQKRAQDNMAQIDSLEMMANQIKVLDGVDEGVKAARLADIRSRIESIAATGNAYEHASSMIRSEAKSFAQDQTLQDASKAYGDYAAMSAEAKSNDVSSAQLVKLNNAMSQYKTAGGAAKGAKLGSVSFYKEEDLAKAVADVVAGWKASGTVTSTSADGYIHKRDFESISATEVQAAAVAYLQSNPKFMRQLSDQAYYRTYVEKINKGFKPEFSYEASYGGGDAEAFQKNLGLAYNDAVKLGVDKTSYTKDSRTKVSDTSYWAALKHAEDNNLATVIGPGVNTRQYPESFDAHKTQLQSLSLQLANVNKDLAGKGNSKGIIEGLTAQKAALTKEIGVLNGLFTTYTEESSKSLTVVQRKELEFSKALTKAGVKVPPQKYVVTKTGARVPIHASDGTMPEEASRIFVKVYGRKPHDNTELSKAVYDGNHLTSDEYNKKAFGEYLKKTSDSKLIVPKIYVASGVDKSTRASMEEAIRLGTFTGYSPSASGSIPDNAMVALQKTGLLLKGVTGVTDVSRSMVVVTVPIYNETKHAGLDSESVEYLKKYSGQTLYLEEGGGTNNTGALAETMIRGAAQTARQAKAAGLPNYSATSLEAIDDLRQTDPGNPYTYATLINAMGSGTKGTSLIVHPKTAAVLGSVTSYVTPGGSTVFSVISAGGKVSESRYTKQEAIEAAEDLLTMSNT